MNQATIQCPNCGETEAPGTQFCGTCGTRLGGAGASGGAVAGLLRHPFLAALLGGAAFSVVAILLLAAFASDGEGLPSSQPGSSGSSASAQGSGPSPSVTPARDGATPAATTAAPGPGLNGTATATSTSPPATPTTLPPTATPLPPTATPLPPTSTPVPLPTATTAPSIPAQKTSPLVSLSITGGHGSSHQIGALVDLCYGSLAGQYIRLLDFQPPETFRGVLLEGVDDGTGDCLRGVIEPPAGFEVFRIEVLNASRDAVVDYAELWIQVRP